MKKGDAPVTASSVAIADYSHIVPDESRRKILTAAIEVIAENAFENVTMEQIALQAGVSRLKLYRDFGNRGALVEAVISFRLMLFDQEFFASTTNGLHFSTLIERYLLASAKASRQNKVTRRWASGGMKFLYAGSLVHRTAVATWSPEIARAHARGDVPKNMSAGEIVLWLNVLQYSIGRMIVDTELDDAAVKKLIKQFVLPAFKSPS